MAAIVPGTWPPPLANDPAASPPLEQFGLSPVPFPPPAPAALLEQLSSPPGGGGGADWVSVDVPEGDADTEGERKADGERSCEAEPEGVNDGDCDGESDADGDAEGVGSPLTDADADAETGLLVGGPLGETVRVDERDCDTAPLGVEVAVAEGVTVGVWVVDSEGVPVPLGVPTTD